jgi:DNA-binding transcriptional LysR family regulator
MDRLDLLGIFVAVAELGSFKAASDRLGRSPAAVTRAVAQLEDRLGVRLLNRTTRAVGLTETGEKYLDQCRRLLSEYAELEGVVEGEAGAVKGRLTVTAPAVFGRLHVMPILGDFVREFPGVEAHALLLDRVVSLVDEGVDVGVRIAHLPDSSLRAIRVGQMRRVIAASPAYLERHGTPVRPRDVAGHQIIGVGAVNPLPDRWTLIEEEAAITVGGRARIYVNTVEAALDLATGGMGLGSFYSYQVAPLEKEGRLVRILSAYAPPPTPIHIVHPAGRYLPPKVRLFIDRAVEALRRDFGADDRVGV